MKKYSLIILFLIVHCGIKQPVDILVKTAVGHIFVSSAEKTGKIFLDGEYAGKTTPDTLFNISVGPHVIRVAADGFRSTPDSVNVAVKENSLSRADFLLEKLVLRGSIGVTSMPDNAEIFVDGMTTGSYTPDTLQLETGLRQVKISKNGYHFLEWNIEVFQDSLHQVGGQLEVIHRILLESFANVSCVPCSSATDTLHRFLADKHSDAIAVIEYFANWPSPNDPFYKVSPQDVMQRLIFYSVAALPALRIGGTQDVNALDLQEMNAVFEAQREAAVPKIGLSVDRKLVEGELRVAIEVHHFNGDFSGFADRLFVLVTESDINFESPPGSNGMTHFDYVFRTFLSSAEGDEISSLGNSIAREYFLTWPGWNYSNCRIIAFIQNKTTGQIIQSSIN